MNKIMSGEFHSAVQDVVIQSPQIRDDDFESAKESSDSTSPLSCELCNVKVTSAKILQRHLEGRKHKMKVQRQGKTFICELCDVTANSEIQLNIHLNSTKHKNKLLKKDNPSPRDSTSNKIMWLLFICIVFITVHEYSCWIKC